MAFTDRVALARKQKKVRQSDLGKPLELAMILLVSMTVRKMFRRLT